jgi:16S rRNA (uracil1498-N3)-methyltransferase
MTRPVFLAAPSDLLAAREGGEAGVGGPEARHAATVRRIRAGEEIDLVDGAGRRVTGTVTGVAPARLTVSVTAVDDEAAPVPALVLVQALAKGGRDESAVEQSTELGVDRVIPWQADRSVSRWDAKAAKGRARWAAIAAGAAKQSRRAFVPGVEDVRTTGRLVEAARAAAEAGSRVLVLHEEATEPITTVPLVAGPRHPVDGDRAVGAPATTDPTSTAPVTGDPTTGEGPREVWIVVGPEGGIGAEESDRLVEAGATLVRLGRHVLRSSSAGPAAIAALSVRLGRW